MLIKILSQLKQQLPFLLVVMVAAVVCILNYRPGTWLSGWDTLHPELDLSLYTKRVFFGAWQEHQGLGAPASQAHLAELPRLPILWMLSLFIPDSAVRYTFFFMMYVLGGIGTYLFISRAWFRDLPRTTYQWPAALGALFYLLNLGTLQHFYVPLEMFAVHFATIGFVLWSIMNVVKEPHKKNWAVFFFIQILSAPSAHTATLFYAYMTIVGLFTTILVICENRHRFDKTIISLTTFAVLVFVAHSYWLLPNLYYVISHNDYVQNAKISRNFSQEAFWQNQAYGNLYDVIIFKNFLFNWKDYDFEERSFVDLFNEWRPHLVSRLGYPVLFILSLTALFGLMITLRKRPQGIHLAVIVTSVVSLFFLVNLNFPFAPIFKLIYEQDTLREALRFPFTKFSILFMLTMSTFFAQGTSWMFAQSKCHYLKLPYSIKKALILVAFSGLILYGSLPVFYGNLISPSMKVEYPSSYKALYSWLNSHSDQVRIAKFPINSYWGWVYHNWPVNEVNQGYQGAGFTWFGIPQPTLDREFDRWAETNEFFFQEAHNAILYKDNDQLKAVFKKYQISYLLFDTSILSTDKNDFQSDVDLTQSLLKDLGLSPIWEDGTLTVYDVRNSQSTDTYLLAPSFYQKLISAPNNVSFDVAYANNGDYISEIGQIFPWNTLISERVSNVTYLDKTLRFTPDLTPQMPTDEYIIKSHKSDALTLPVIIDYSGKDLDIKFPLDTKIQVGTQFIALKTLPPIHVSLASPINSLVLNLSQNQFVLKPGDMIRSGVTLSSDTKQNFYYFDQDQVIQINNGLAVDSSDITTIEYNNDLNSYFNFSEVINQENQHLPMAIETSALAVPLELPQGNANNCENDGKGIVNKTVTDQGIQYRANRFGINCDSIRLPFQNSQTYLMRIKGSNTTGRSLKFQLKDEVTDTTILEELMPEGGFDQTYFVKTPESDTFLFRLGWETRSFGQLSQNTLSNVEVYPLPLHFLSGIHLEPHEQTTLFANSATISKLWKFGTHQYGAVVNNTGETGQLVLGQTFDQAWVALSLRNPFKFFPHSSYNNWANAWSLPKGEYQVQIIYLPQLISFCAMALLLILASCLFPALFKSYKLNKTQSFLRNSLKGKTKKV